MTSEISGSKSQLGAQLRSHLPILGLIVLVGVVFAGLHGAATVAAWGIGLHVLLGVSALAFQHLRKKSRIARSTTR